MKLLFKTVCLIFITITISAQTRGPQILVIEYDFSRDSANRSKNYWVREQSGVEFKIKNINLFNYNVNINNSKEDYVNSDNNTSLQNQYNHLFFVESLDTHFFQEVNRVKSLENTIKKENTEKLAAQNFLKNNESIKAEFELAINNRVARIKDYSNQLSIVNTEWLHQSILYYKDLFILLHSEAPIQEIVRARDSLTNLFYEEFIKRNGEVIRYCVAYNQIISRRERTIAEINNKIISTQDLLTDVTSIEELISNDPGSNKTFTLFRAELAGIRSTSTQLIDRYKVLLEILSSEKIEKLANEVQKLYMSFEGDNHEVHIKEYNLENIDNVTLGVTIEPKKTTLGYRSRKESFTTNIRTYGGIRFDVSAGLMFNFDLNDGVYYYDSSKFTSDTVRISRQKDRNSYLPFIGSQLNVYLNKPLKCPFSPGFTVGVSTNLSDIRYYFGGSITVGNKDRIVLAGGLVGGQVNQLSGRFTTDQLYMKKAIPEVPELTKAFKLGYFVSLTYNLTSNNAKRFGESITKK